MSRKLCTIFSVGLIVISLNIATAAATNLWIGQPYWDLTTMRVWAASEYNSGFAALQTVAGSAGTLVGDLHNNDGSGYGMWKSTLTGGGGANPSPSGSIGATWLAFDFGVGYRLDTMWVWNFNQSGSTSRGLRNVTIEYSEDYVHWTKLGDYEFAQAQGTANMPHNIEVNFGGVKARFVVITAKTTNGNWGNIYYGLSEVRFYGLSSGIPMMPIPANAEQCTDTSALLRWTDDPNIVSYNVYFGTNLNEVRNINRLSGDVNGDGEVDFIDIAELASWWLSMNEPPITIDLVSDGKVDFSDYAVVANDFGKSCDAVFKGSVDVNSFDPGGLAYNQTYYWRIDKITHDGVYKGVTWNFTTCYSSVDSEYFVAADGNDNNPGTIAQPFKTLEKARDTLRCKCLPTSGVTVYLRGGKYFRTDELQLTTQDSGKTGKPITYRAYPGENVRIIGGVQLPSSWFTLVTSFSPVWSRIRTGARGNVYECNLAAHGITNYGSVTDNFNRPDLSFNGQLMQLTRWPNSGYTTVSSAQSTTQFTYSGTQPGMWTTSEPERMVGGYWYYGWHYTYHQISSVDTVNKSITLSMAPPYGIKNGQLWCGLNMLCEIDSPGEWYLERSTGMLYFWPPSDISSAEVLFSTLGTTTKCLVEAANATDIVFRDIAFEMCRFRPIQILGGRDILVDNCRIKNTGEVGIAISGGEHHGVQNCDISVTGGEAIYVAGGSRSNLTSSGHSVCNNSIHDHGFWQHIYTPGVYIDGVGVTVEHNCIYNAPHFGIYYRGNNHTIRFNEIYNVCYETDDAGAIYSGRDWGYRGNKISHNLIRNLSTIQPTQEGVIGIYFDDCYSSADVFGNIFYNISGRAMLVGGGRDNTFENNVVARCNRVIWVDKRGLTWAPIGGGDPSWDLLGKIEEMNYTLPPWSTAYPALASILDEGWEQAKAPKGNKLRKNIGWLYNTWTEGDGISYFTIENNITNQNPLFVDEANLNLALRDDSPAYTIPGFVRIPFEAIGLLSTTKATRPNPSVGLVNVSVQADVYWAPAFGAAQRDIYFGTDVSSVTNATSQSPMGVYWGRQSGISFDPGPLGAATAYYWRIDEVDSNGNLVGKGDIWSFTTN